MKTRSAAAYTMGSGSRTDLANTKANKFIPGPGNYSASVIPKQNAPSFGFGKEIQRTEVAKTGKQATPAPGAYNTIDKVGKEGVSVSMSPLYHDKHKEKVDRSTPGPGSYGFENRAMKTAPNYGFGKEKQRAAVELGSKGVTTEMRYDPVPDATKGKLPAYGFGTDKRRTYEDKM